MLPQLTYLSGHHKLLNKFLNQEIILEQNKKININKLNSNHFNNQYGSYIKR
jgi:hypothetical protein